MKIFRNQEGQTLVLTALCGSVLLGFLGLALDVGTLFHTRRALQTAADAGAVAAALQAEYGQTISPCTSGVQYQCAAAAAAVLNGVSASNVTVNVGTSISTGYHKAAGFYEVIVSQPSPTYFMGALGFGSVNVSARAVAGSTPGLACMYVLDPNNHADVLYTKHTISASNCGVQVNSSSKQATCDHGSGALKATFLHIVGGQDTGGGCHSNTDTPVTTGVLPTGDPLNLSGPNPATACTAGNTFIGTTLSNASQLPAATPNADGIASDGVVCFSSTVTISDGVTLPPAVYVFKNGVNVGNITVNGGTLDNAGGTFTVKNNTLTVTAPANRSAIYNGIAIMQPAYNTTAANCGDGFSAPCLSLQFGSSSANINGIIYAPTSEVYFHDMGGAINAADIIAYDFGYTNTDVTLSDSYNHANPSTTPLTHVLLVE
jgi:Flp pilus assembly protein TadG